MIPNTQAAMVVAGLRRLGRTLAVAESCTGGMLSAALTAVPGSSAVFGYGFITYANSAKHLLLGVPLATLDQYGAVSAETALAMACGAREKATSDYAVSMTGIAGPDGGSAEKPVGTVFIAVAQAHHTAVQRLQFSGDRAAVRSATVNYALTWMTQELI